MASKFAWNRRSFVKGAAVLGAARSFPEAAWRSNSSNNRNRSPPEKCHRTGVQVSAMGLGGYHLGSAETDQAAVEIVAKAFDHGVRFFDNAWEYHDGLSEPRHAPPLSDIFLALLEISKVGGAINPWPK